MPNQENANNSWLIRLNPPHTVLGLVAYLGLCSELGEAFCVDLGTVPYFVIRALGELVVPANKSGIEANTPGHYVDRLQFFGRLWQRDREACAWLQILIPRARFVFVPEEFCDKITQGESGLGNHAR